MGNYEITVRTATAEESTTPAAELPSILLRRPSGTFVLELGALAGAHALHFAAAVCVFNGLIREARNRGIALENAVVRADGDFADNPERSTGICYQIEVAGDASEEELRSLVHYVEHDASVPQILQRGMPVALTETKIVSSQPLKI